MLRIENLSKTYANGVRALDGVSLDIPRGMFGLLGPNGAGKSTLMRTLATLQEPDSGTARLGDLDILQQKSEVRKVLGYLPQEFGVYPKISAEAMLNHFAVLKGLTRRKERLAVVDALLKQTNLHQHRKKRLGTFSGGMKQRFGIAQALLGEPQLVIVDEPTAGLDPEERARFLNLLAEIGEQVVVILSTHIVEDVSDLCSRMAILGEGKVWHTGEPASAIGKLEGKIWKRAVPKQDLAEFRDRHRVLSSRLFAGRTEIRVLAEECPAAGFEPEAPDLADVYFTTLPQARQANAAAA